MIGIATRGLTAVVVIGLFGLALTPTSASSTGVSHHAAHLAAVASFDGSTPPTFSLGRSVEDLEAAAVALAHELHAVPLTSNDPTSSCPLERLRVSWQAPDGYVHGSYIEPVGPRPDDHTTDVNGVVVCDRSLAGFLGFEAHYEGFGWRVYPVPVSELGVTNDVESETPTPTTGTGPSVADLDRPDLGPVDPYAAYDPQRTCEPSPKMGTYALASLLLRAVPGTTNRGISRGCQVGPVSEHKEGRAFDWGVGNGDAGEIERFLARLLATDADGNPHALARRMGVMYIIFNDSIWASYRAEDGWRPYRGPDPHIDHVHISLSWDGALGRTSLWRVGVEDGWIEGLPSTGPVPQRPAPPVVVTVADPGTTRPPRERGQRSDRDMPAEPTEEPTQPTPSGTEPMEPQGEPAPVADPVADPAPIAAPSPTPPPAPEPTQEPTPDPTPEPTPDPASSPTQEPTQEPTEEPIPEPPEEPTGPPQELPPEPPPSPEPVRVHVVGETTTVGTVEGDHLATFETDGTIEHLSEVLLRDATPAGTSALDHTSSFQVPSEGPVSLMLTALVNDGDESFVVSWSLDGHRFSPVVTLPPGAEVLGSTVELGVAPAGPLWVRVMDTDRAPGAAFLDQIAIDELVVLLAAPDDPPDDSDLGDLPDDSGSDHPPADPPLAAPLADPATTSRRRAPVSRRGSTGSGSFL